MSKSISWDEEDDVPTAPALVASPPRRGGVASRGYNLRVRPGYNLRNRRVIPLSQEEELLLQGEDDDDESWYPEDHVEDNDDDLDDDFSLTSSDDEQDDDGFLFDMKRGKSTWKRVVIMSILCGLGWVLYNYRSHGYDSNSMSDALEKLQDLATENFSVSKFFDASSTKDDDVASFKATTKRFQAFRAVKSFWKKEPRDASTTSMASRQQGATGKSWRRPQVHDKKNSADNVKPPSLKIGDLLQWKNDESQPRNDPDAGWMSHNKGWIYSRGRARRPTRNAMVWIRLGDISPTATVGMNQRIVLHTMDKARPSSSSSGQQVHVVVDATDYTWDRIPWDVYQLSHLLPVLRQRYPGYFGTIFLCNANPATRVLLELALATQLHPPLWFSKQSNDSEDDLVKYNQEMPSLHVLSNDPEIMLRQLETIVPLSSIPKSLGGKDSYKFNARKYFGRVAREESVRGLLEKLATPGYLLD